MIQINGDVTNKKGENHLSYLKLRLDETMNEAKRHFQNYINLRNSFNQFLESKFNSG